MMQNCNLKIVRFLLLKTMSIFSYPKIMFCKFVEKKKLTAIAMAMSDSVTVSIGEDTNGAFRVIIFVNLHVRS